MTTSTGHFTEARVEVARTQLYLLNGGTGRPLLVLHGVEGHEGWLAFHGALAEQAAVYAPAHPGFGQTERPAWMRSVRDLAVLYQLLITERGWTTPSLLGLGFGGWIAAEMASMAPRNFLRLILVGAMGLKPAQGEILDQALVSYIDYARAGFEDQKAFDRLFGADPPTPQLEEWDLNREMTFRIAWKPYMYSPTLPHLLPGVTTPALVVWGRRDRVVPLECGEAYARALPGARLAVVDGAGHCLDMEQPEALARLVLEFAAGS